MNGVRPAFIYSLYAALAFYIAGSSLIMVDLYKRIGELQHVAIHLKIPADDPSHNGKSLIPEALHHPEH